MNAGVRFESNRSTCANRVMLHHVALVSRSLRVAASAVLRNKVSRKTKFNASSAWRKL